MRKRLAIPQIRRKSIIGRAQMERLLDLINLMFIQSARSSGPIGIHQTSKPFRLKSADPIGKAGVFSRVGVVATTFVMRRTREGSP